MSNKNSKHIKQKCKSYKNVAFVVLLILIICIAIKKSKIETNNKKTELILNNENVTESLQEDIIIQNGKTYMSLADIKNFIDNTIYKEGTDTIITTSPKKIAILKDGEENIEINGSMQKAKDVIIEREQKDYLAISELENVYDYEFKYISSNNIVTIDNLNKKSIKAYARKNLNIKKEQNIISKTVDKVEKGNWIIYICDAGNMAKVRTQNGFIGFVKKSNLNNFVTEREDLNTSTEFTGNDEEKLKYDISNKDITTYEKRKIIINLILQEAIKNDKMYVEITCNNENTQEYNRFKIEITPILSECGIKVDF